MRTPIGTCLPLTLINDYHNLDKHPIILFSLKCRCFFFQKFSILCIVLSTAKYYVLSYIFSRLSISWIHVRSPTTNGQRYNTVQPLVQPYDRYSMLYCKSKCHKNYVHTSTLLNNIIGGEPRTPTADGQHNKHSACCNGSNLNPTKTMQVRRQQNSMRQKYILMW